MASEFKKNLGQAAKITATAAIAAPAAYLGLARTGLPYWARGGIAFVVEAGLGAALISKAPRLGTGLILSGVGVGLLNGAQEIDKRRFLNSPASRTPLPAIGAGSTPALTVGSQAYDSNGRLLVVAQIDANGQAMAADGTQLFAARPTGRSNDGLTVGATGFLPDRTQGTVASVTPDGVARDASGQAVTAAGPQLPQRRVHAMASR